jgi:two-component sensor histidine kinase
VGLPANFDFNETESLGLKLVRILTRQLEGELKLDISQGTCFEIIFSELDYCDRI